MVNYVLPLSGASFVCEFLGLLIVGASLEMFGPHAFFAKYGNFAVPDLRAICAQFRMYSISHILAKTSISRDRQRRADYISPF